MKKAVIFDLDGTVSNTIDTIAYFANLALEHFGYPAIETETYKVLVGNGAKVLVERMMQHVGAPKEQFNEIYTYYVEAYDKDFMFLTRPYDGIIEMLDALKAKGIKTAVLTNKPHMTACKVIEDLFGDKILLCRGVKDDGICKPKPDGVYEIMKTLNINNKEDYLYVGDTGTDMQTGKNAGLFSVGVTWGFRKREELEQNGADAIIDAPMQLLDLI